MKPAEFLTNWVKQKHKGQIKKYSGQPYFSHLMNVADMAKPVTSFGYEIGLCHDILEDTKVTENELFEALLSFGYSENEANYITIRVVELTDIFTSEAYPELSRETRKELEISQMPKISPGAQTVKYCDLIDNMNLVIKFDHENTYQYLQKKKRLLNSMIDGNEKIRRQALEIIDKWIISQSGGMD
jgi:(p)ppGpp synthase/HD superfamily hydrolase